jgi:hypothetical protein
LPCYTYQVSRRDFTSPFQIGRVVGKVGIRGAVPPDQIMAIGERVAFAVLVSNCATIHLHFIRLSRYLDFNANHPTPHLASAWQTLKLEELQGILPLQEGGKSKTKTLGRAKITDKREIQVRKKRNGNLGFAAPGTSRSTFFST